MQFPHLPSLLSRFAADPTMRGERCDASDPEDYSTWAAPSARVVERLDSLAVRQSYALLAGGHFDAGESATLARQLLFVKVREANVVYPSLKAASFIPISNQIPSGAESFSVKIWDIAGSAKIVANYAKDFPASDTSISEVIAPIRSVGNSYHYTIQELRNSLMVPGLQLDVRRADAARMVHDRAIDKLAAYGSLPNGLTGFAVNSNVGLTSITGTWASATSAQILADMNKIAQAVVDQSLQTFAPDTMILPTAAWGIVATRPYSDLNPSPILSVFLQNSPYIKSVDSWNRLNANSAANPTGLTYNRIVCYLRDPMVLELEIPQVFEQLPPQLEGMQYTVPCHSRCGGVSIHYPVAMTYADGV